MPVSMAMEAMATGESKEGNGEKKSDGQGSNPVLSRALSRIIEAKRKEGGACCCCLHSLPLSGMVR